MVLLFQMPECALNNHLSYSFFLMILIYTSLKVRYFNGVRIPFIAISYFTFLWICIRLSSVLSVVVIPCMHRSYRRRLFASLLIAYNSRYEYCFLSNDITS